MMNKQRAKLFGQLFLVFAKIGAMSFGGGYVMLPLMQKEVSGRRGWLTDEEVADVFSLAQCTPGIVAGNTATYIGNRVAGFFGGLCALMGVVMPSLLIILLLAGVLDMLRANEYFVWAMNGIKIVVCALIISAVVRLWKTSVRGWFGYAVFFLSLGAALFLSISPVFVVLFGAVAGIVLYLIGGRRGAK